MSLQAITLINRSRLYINPSIPAEEKKASSKVRNITEENKRLQNEIADCRSSQPSLVEIRKNLADLQAEIESVKSKQSDVKLQHMQESSASEEEKVGMVLT